MRGLMPNSLTKLSESTEEDEVLRSRKRKLDMGAESDGEQLREQLRLHLEDKRILNGDAGKRLRRDFGRLLKSGEEGVPMADIDYEIYKYINELADQYIELDDLLEQNGVSYSEALEQAAQFRKQFLCLLEKHAVRNQDLVVICWDLMERIEQQPEHPDLQYLYFCVVTDFGLLNAVNAADRTEEQKIRNYFRQQNALRELTDFFQAQSENLQKYHALLEYLKKPRRVESGVRNEEDFDLLYHLTAQHAFLYGCKTNPVYEENLRALQLHINNDAKLKAVKPYIIFAVLARKTGMMQKRKYFMPNLKYKKLTPSQLNIMKTLWDKKEPMIASDFVQLDPSLNLNSVQSALRSLLKKNYIEVSDIVYSGKVLTRRYIPVVSSEDYASENINGVLEDLLSSNILLQYVESENDIKVIERLQEKLEERKKILERKS